MEPKPKSQPSFFQQLHRDKTQRHSTITQRQNSNPNFLAPDTKLNPDFLMLFEKPNTKLKTQNSNPKLMNKTQDPKTINNHGFRERELGF